METINDDNHSDIYKHIVDSKVFPYLFDGLEFIDFGGKDFEYVKALCILCFDDEIGTIAENVYPSKALDKNVIKQISALGFPETNSISEDGELEYIFKVRESK
jgi:hypothetical protein